MCWCAVVEDDPVYGCARMHPRQHYPMPRGSFTREWMMMDMMSAERRIGAGYRRMMCILEEVLLCNNELHNILYHSTLKIITLI